MDGGSLFKGYKIIKRFSEVIFLNLGNGQIKLAEARSQNMLTNIKSIIAGGEGITTEFKESKNRLPKNLMESICAFLNRIGGDILLGVKDDGSITGVSVRNKLFREVTANILIHREYSNPYPAKFIIENDRVITENGNKANGFGEIDIDNFTPYPKNPIIAKVFKEIGRADELGSGIKNIKKYSKIYSNSKPIFIEGDIFKTIIPLTTHANPQATMQATMQADEEMNKLIEYCKIPKTREEMQNFMKLANRDYFRKNILNPLIEKGLLKLQIPDKPTSPNQKYYS